MNFGFSWILWFVRFRNGGFVTLAYWLLGFSVVDDVAVEFGNISSSVGTIFSILGSNKDTSFVSATIKTDKYFEGRQE